ncbi:AAA family ATPase [Paenibacillus sp. 1781tsa1]|uniref:AAA family ATPase n=1 Tax=Paenibacillus sp. 1781tsa1 TaxID=2953810 RepID=UPI00209F9ADE|nr:AAA family ATPase [Paenibacillus sp. 1781tsa1]MCP1183754.1 ATP-binding protein [Paenibacillus sp. 1781tsa1]
MVKNLYIISGPPGVGKSTTSKLLVQTLDKSAYISGDTVSHFPVKGRGKPWLDKDTNDLTWKNISSLVKNLLDYKYDVVLDYVTFPEDVDVLMTELADYHVRIIYVVLLVDRQTIIRRDRLRAEEHQMKERSVILLDEFVNHLELRVDNKLYTNHFTEDQLPEIVSEIINNEKYRVR